jgi:signal transduction histidine kinase
MDSGGAGLGLAIAQWVARLHGGDVTLTSSSPRGTVFRISLAAETAAKIEPALTVV